MQIFTDGKVTTYTRQDNGEEAKGFNLIIPKNVEKEIKKIFHFHFGDDVPVGQFTDEDLLNMVVNLLEEGIDNYKIGGIHGKHQRKTIPVDPT